MWLFQWKQFWNYVQEIFHLQYIGRPLFPTDFFNPQKLLFYTYLCLGVDSIIKEDDWSLQF